MNLIISSSDIVLRVPAVFAMDALLNSGYEKNMILGSVSSLEPTEINDEDTVLVTLEYFSFLKGLLGFLAAFTIFVLPGHMLMEAYKWLTSIAAIVAFYWTNSIFLDRSQDSPSPPKLSNAEILSRFGVHFLLQSLFAWIFISTYTGTKGPRTDKLLVLYFVMPSFLSIHNIGWLPWSAGSMSNPTCLLRVNPAIFYVISGVCSNFRYLYFLVRRAFFSNVLIVRHHGLHVLLENEWLRLKVPQVLRLFWLIRFCEHIVFHIIGQMSMADDGNPEAPTPAAFGFSDLVDIGKQLMVRGCDTVVAVLGMTSVVASVAHSLSYAVQQFLMTDDDEEKSFGTVSAILFFILALQTGLTGLEPEKRFIRLYRNFCLLFTAVLHFVHNMVNPLLMSLSASRNRSLQHHGRALVVCSFLVAFPCWFLFYLWRTHNVSTWLLAVSAFSIEVAIKVIISLLIYLLFMIDAYRNTFWEKLDDYVYYVRATGNTIEFIFGIFLFFNGAWILLFESGGTIRACMMCIHAYFNIWMQAKAGWQVFVRRRSAVNKINSFPEATVEQLQKLNDVCAICYQEMTTARRTWCKHYFHALCLRKWLYIQDRCPMCHKALYDIDEAGNNPIDNLVENMQLQLQPPAHLRDDSQNPRNHGHEHQD